MYGKARIRKSDNVLMEFQAGIVDDKILIDNGISSGHQIEDFSIIEVGTEIELESLIQHARNSIPRYSEKREIKDIKGGLVNSNVWLFRMILEIYEVGKSKGVWGGADFSADVRQKALEWKTKLERLRSFGE